MTTLLRLSGLTASLLVLSAGLGSGGLARASEPDAAATAFGRALAQTSEPDPAAVEFGEKLVRALNARDEAELRRLIDGNAVGMRTARLLSDNEAEQRDFASGVDGKLVPKLIQPLEQTKGSVRMLKVVERDGVPCALVRYSLGDTGYDYHEYLLEPDGAGSYRAVDWYALHSGELMSTTLATTSQMVMDSRPGAALSSLLGIKSFDPRVLEQFKRIGKLESEGKFLEASAVVDQLPPAVARSRVMLFKKMALASKAGDDARYRRALTELAQRFGDDPALGFLLLDHYIDTKDWTRAFASIDAVEGRVGRDALTEYLRAHLYSVQGQREQVIEHARAAIELEPDFEEAYYSLADACVGERRYAEAVDVLKQLETQFGHELVPEKLAAQDEFAELAQSAPFKAWAAEKRAEQPASSRD